MTPRNKGVRVWVLVEDIAQERFARRVLGRMRYTVYVLPYKVRQGGGAQDVLKSYPGEVVNFRGKAFDLGTGFLVCIDADKYSVQNRSGHLARELAKSGAKSRDNSERIAHWIPKRNMETWYWHLMGNAADETDDYKRRVEKLEKRKEIDYKRVADEFVRLRGEFKGGKAPELPALEAAFRETDRLEP